MLKVDGHTRQLGIIGDPVEHSFSPAMHNFISELTGSNYIYSAWRVTDVENAINGVRALGIRGINVTAPHKVKVMRYLDEIDEKARLLGSVNTVVNTDGYLKGYNTDADGFYMSLIRNGIEIRDKNILIIGAGGVTEPAVIRFSYEDPASVTVINRTHGRTLALAERVYEKTGFKIETEAGADSYDVIINTTSAGMAPQLDVLPTDAIDGVDVLSLINENTAAVDMIYNPEETLFLREAKLRGAKTMNGLGMLIYQGIIAYELFTDTKLSDDIYDRIREEVFG